MENETPFSKSQTIDPEVRAYVYSLVNALGGTSGDESGRYILGDDALAVLRDLKRWLKLYDEKTNRLDVARCLAEAKLVTGDLLPILASWTEGNKNDKLRARAALACLELLVPLTWPLENGEMTVNHHRHTPYLQQAQVFYKAGILNWDNATLLRQAIRIGLPAIAMRRDERTTRDDSVIKIMLYFFRNVTAIRQLPNLPSQGLDNEVSRSATIEAFRAQDVFALVLTMCSNMTDDFQLQDVIILEILFNLVKGVNVQKLWMTESQRKGKEVSDLKETLNQEASMHKDAKKSEWSRHGRFGTMIWVKREGDKVSAVSGQDNLRDERTALFNIDKSKKWSKPQRKQKDIDHSINDFDREIQLTSSASEMLRNFAEEFLDAGFNPLFVHLRKAIEREAERLLDINYRQFFYTVAWFLQAERIRRERQTNEAKPAKITTDFGAESFGLVAGVLNQEFFITLNRYMQNSLDNKEWQDLNASMKCFTQILLTIQEMAQSPLEEDQEIAENIQNRIFYEETTHDRIVSLLKGYRDQGFGYLDAVTELSHVFLRMLERYSKENGELQVRSRRKARQKRKEAKTNRAEGSNENNTEEEADSEDEDANDVAQISRERKFDLKRFFAKFISQSSVDTFVAFSTFFLELNAEQLKRAHRFFYRVAFKQDLAVLLYRVDIIALFYKMVQGPGGLPRNHTMYSEWSQFTKQVLRKMLKKLDERPELLVELVFSKINKTLYYLEFGHEKINSSTARAPAELEIDPSAALGRCEQIGLLVTLLLKDEKQALVVWMKTSLNKAFDERAGWEVAADARKAKIANEGEEFSEPAVSYLAEAEPTYIVVRPTTPDLQIAMFKNARLRLLMKVVGFEILGQEDTVDATWIIPSQITAAHIAESKAAIEQYEISPWTGQNADDAPEDMIHRVRQPLRNTEDDAADNEAIRDGFIDDSEGDENPNLDEEFLFPDNIRSKSKRNAIEELKTKRRLKRKRISVDDDDDDADIDDELAAERRKARNLAALERRRKIKSELYIRDSDDESDTEKDKEFFAQEEQTRARQANLIKQQMSSVQGKSETGKNKRLRKPGKERTNDLTTSDDDGSNSDSEAIGNDGSVDQLIEQSSQPTTLDGSDVHDMESQTPLSSPQISVNGNEAFALKEMPQPPRLTDRSVGIKPAIDADIELDDGSEEDEMPTKAAMPARRRGGFILDSDDED